MKLTYVGSCVAELYVGEFAIKISLKINQN